MPINIKYYNSFILKKTVNNTIAGVSAYIPVFTGLPWNPTDSSSDNNDYPAFITSSDNLDGKAKWTSDSSTNQDNWIIEESRIRGGFNEVEVGYSPRAYLREDTNEGKVRYNSLIYSGVYNSLTGLNETNVFSVAEQITKSIDPTFGSIQKLHALDNNLAIFQESKVSRALIDKDAIYSAEGGGTVTSTKLVIGQVQPYVGEYGISTNPESFANFGTRRYFSDKYRNAIMRLSNDGLTEISQYGMRDFFRDKLGEVNDRFYSETFDCPVTTWSPTLNSIQVNDNIDKIEKGLQITIPQSNGTDIIARITGYAGGGTYLVLYFDQSIGTPSGDDVTITKFVKDKVVGGFDAYNDNYVISLQKETNFLTETTGQPLEENPNDRPYYYTTSFDEGALGWTSFYTYKPSFIFSLKNDYFTTNGHELYKHYSNNQRNTFYQAETPDASTVTFVFNANPSIVKNFKTVNYEGDSGWEVLSFESDKQGIYFDETKPVKSYDEGEYVDQGVTYRAGFNRKENKYFANLVSNSSARPGEVLFGNETTGVKGFFTTVKFSTDATTDEGGSKELFAVSTEFVVSSR
jgi:hypothetical protein